MNGKGRYNVSGWRVNVAELRQLRLARGWSYREVQRQMQRIQREETGVEAISESRYRMIEGGSNCVRINTLKILSEVFEVAPVTLLTDEEKGRYPIKIAVRPTGGEAQSNSTKELLPGISPPFPSLVVGRADDERLVQDHLMNDPLTIDGRPVQVVTAVRGLPGVGKTTLVTALAFNENVRSFFDRILYVAIGRLSPVKAPGALRRQLLEWASVVDGISCERTMPLDTIQGLLRDRLFRERTLILIDDAWAPEHVGRFLVGGPNSATLIATRDGNVARKIARRADAIHTLECLDDASSIELLRHLASPVFEEFPKECKRLARQLEGLPIALCVAGAALWDEWDRAGDLPRLFVEIEELQSLLRSKTPVDVGGITGSSSSTVRAVFKTSTDRLSAASLRCFLKLGSVPPDPAEFTLDFLASLWNTTVDQTRKTTGELLDRGLITKTREDVFRIHSVLAAHAKSLRGRKK